MIEDRNLQVVLEAAQFVEENLFEPITVATVCANFSMSAWQVQRIFRALSCESIGAFLRGRRMTIAAGVYPAHRFDGFLKKYPQRTDGRASKDSK